MVIKANFGNKANVVATYDIKTANDVSFKVILTENTEGLREFEIVLSSNGKPDFTEIFSHPFYQDFVLPWTYRAKEIEPSTSDSPKKVGNVFDISKYRK